jgi:hypothetical protein
MKLATREGARPRPWWLVLAPLIFIAGSDSLGQAVCEKPSAESDLPSQGANEVIEFREIRTVKFLSGRVLDVNGANINAAVFDVFPATRLAERVPASSYIVEEDRIKSYHVNREGAFCISDLPDGEYILRFGATGGFNHTLIKIRKKKSASRKLIEIELKPGT